MGDKAAQETVQAGGKALGLLLKTNVSEEDEEEGHTKQCPRGANSK